MRQIDTDTRLVAEIILQLGVVLGVVVLQQRADVPGSRILAVRVAAGGTDAGGRDRAGQTQNNNSLHNPRISVCSLKPNKLLRYEERVGLR